MKGIVDWRTKPNSVLSDGFPDKSGKGSVREAIFEGGRLQLLILKTALLSLLMLLVSSCAAPEGSSSLSGLYGKEVLVTMAPTVIATATTSEVRENKVNGKLIAADDNWVVVNTDPEQVAVSREKIITITEVRSSP